MNILIITGKFGLGHDSAAEALREQLCARMADANIMVEDLFETLMRNHSSAMYKGFSYLVKKGSKIYNVVYRSGENQKNEGNYPFFKRLKNKFSEWMDQVEPDVIISVLPFCAFLAADYKRNGKKNPFLVTCITDVSGHNEWLFPETDLYLVASESTKACLVKKNIPGEKIVGSGVPVKTQFTRPVQRCAASEKRILIMGGGLGILPKAPEFYQRLAELRDVRITVIAGENKAFLQSMQGKYPNMRVLGHVDNVYQYMLDADLLISKPGGMTVFEAIFAELPLLVFPPFLEQEVKNGAFIRDNAFGVIVRGRPEHCIAQIDEMLRDADLLERIRGNMRRFKFSLDEDTLAEYLRAHGAKEVCA